MQDSDIIVGFKAKIDYAKLGLDVSALITIISESSEHYYDVIEKANETIEVVECYATTGSGSHVLLIRTESTKSLEKFLRTKSTQF